jgi:hypothetical protein
MRRSFKVRWPVLARIEAFLVFAAVVVLCGRSPAIRSVMHELSTISAAKTGLPDAPVASGLLACLMAGPYLAIMTLVDRMLPSRGGYACGVSTRGKIASCLL